MSKEQLNHDPQHEDREDVNVGASFDAPTGSSSQSFDGSGSNVNDPSADSPSEDQAQDQSETDQSFETESAQDEDGQDAEAQPLDDPEAGAEDISHLEAQMSDMDVSQDANDVAVLREELAQQGDELARARADYYNLTQTHNNYVRRSKSDISAARAMGHSEVVEALMPVLDDIEAARTAGALEDGPFAAIATKLESTLATRFHFERYGEVGEAFDPNIHEAVMVTPSAEYEVETVQQVIQSGYKSGDKVLRAAKVIVANPQ